MRWTLIGRIGVTEHDDLGDRFEERHVGRRIEASIRIVVPKTVFVLKGFGLVEERTELRLEGIRRFDDDCEDGLTRSPLPSDDTNGERALTAKPKVGR
jgi:hypothetical protein